MVEDQQVVVVDNGSGEIKAGFSGEDKPRAIFPSIIGRYKNKNVFIDAESTDLYIGDEAK